MNENEIYNENYYKQYDLGIGKVDYKESKHLKDFMAYVAQRIVEDLHPQTVLDAGCALGHLVAALRDRGVEAYGVDVSEYAISNVREDIRPYCAVGSLTRPLPETLPRRYDLVVTMEVLEHLCAEEGKAAVQNLCMLGDRILFCSTPDDYTEPTHVNVQQREYWARLFAEQGFYDDLGYRPTYVASYASLFHRSEDMVKQIEDYERNLRETEKTLQDRTAELEETQRVMNATGEQLAQRTAKLEETQRVMNATGEKLAQRTAELERARAELGELKREQDQLERKYEEMRSKLTETRESLAERDRCISEIQASFSWKITRPLMKIKLALHGAMEKHGITRKLWKALSILRRQGPRELARTVRHYREKRREIQKLAGDMGVSESAVLAEDNLTGFAPYESEYQADVSFSDRTTDVKLLAFYLPQFHTFPENDEWWGKGFTEWVNVRAGDVRFAGHYQPRVPHEDIGYYCLDDVDVIRRQTELAKAHGIYGFCFYYYWFSGKRLMERPVDLLLRHPEIDLPFCLCWANENWTRAWDGQKKNVLIEQKYQDSDPERFIADLRPYLEDHRYIRIGGKPLILVYNPGELPDCKTTFARWRECARKMGIGEILIWTCQTANNTASSLKIEDAIDAEVEFPPHNLWVESLAVRGMDLGKKSAFIYNYQRLVDYITRRMRCEQEGKKPVHHSFMLAWDNAARRKDNWCTFYAFSLRALYRWVLEVVRKTRETFPPEERFAFVNAWNEWGEGTYLEPDERYGYANINTVSKALFGLPFREDLKILGKRAGEQPTHAPAGDGSAQIAVQVHMFYLDTLEETIERLNAIPYPFDCYFSTDTEEKKKIIEESLRSGCTCREYRVEVFENRGRDVAPFLVQMAPVLARYDYICHIHSKKTKTNDHGNEWRKYNFKHLLGSREYILELLELFRQDERLGIVFPETYPVLELQAVWGGNREGAAELLRRIGCSVSLPDVPAFPVGNMFWARTRAVRKLFEAGLSQADFPEEAGQVNATIAHQIERAWVYIARDAGYGYLRVFNRGPDEVPFPQKKRLGIFAHFDAGQVLSEDDVETVRTLSPLFTDLLFVSNSDLPEGEIEKIAPYVRDVRLRKNVGYDFGAWRDRLLELGSDAVGGYDELVLMNNSCLPPVFDLREMFAEMEQKDLDFWGVTLFPYSADGSYIQKDHIPEHLQSYFLTFRKAALESPAFWQFWSEMPDYTDYVGVVANCETQLTERLAKAGLRYEPYIRETYYLSSFLNNYAIPYEKPSSLLLLHDPLVKKKCYQYMSEEERIKTEWLIREMDGPDLTQE